MNTKELIIGKKYEIHAYKHDGKIHRSWDEAVLLEIHEDYLIFGNKRTRVTEADGRVWRTKEPAVLYFYFKDWYNIIGQYKKNGVYYYCNISSPFIIAHCIGAEPLYLGSKDECTFTHPYFGISSITFGNILPYATTAITSGLRFFISSITSELFLTLKG